MLNEHELARQDPAELLAAGPSAVVVTRGAAGCLVVDVAGTRTVPASSVAEVVDTTGAGDCFAAALAFGVGSRWPLDRSVALANAAAGLSIGAPGARGGLPRARQLELQ